MTPAELIEKYGSIESKARLPETFFAQEAVRIEDGIKVSNTNYWFTTILPILEELDIEREIALDVGCGFGQNTVPLVNHFDHVHGIDFCEYKIDWAKKYFPGYGVEFRVHDITRDMLVSNINYVQTVTVLQHINIEDKCHILPNIYSCLAKGGVAILAEGRVVQGLEEDKISSKQKHMFSTPLSLLEDVFDEVEYSNGILVCRKNK